MKTGPNSINDTTSGKEQDLLVNSNSYFETLKTIKSRIKDAQYKSMSYVNSQLIELHWSVGNEINQHKEWGNKFIETLALDIKKEFPNVTGFGTRNLKYMSKFAEVYPDYEIVQPVVAQLSWSHNVVLLDMVNDEIIRIWYLNQAVKEGWSKRELQHQIESKLHMRQSENKTISNYDDKLTKGQSNLAQQIIKDPYNFDFVAVRKPALERVIENELVQNITEFLLELGSGFAFVGQQVKVTVNGDNYYVDLLFYQLELRCYVVIELKANDFKPEYAGKLNFYVNAVDGEIAKESDNPTIGILLCRKKNKLVAEYSLKSISSPIAVSDYQITEILPDEFIGKIPTAGDIEARFLNDFLEGENND
jgi:predicted nuclease of restriction endonuclease-like (RecB) superfamily